MRYAPFRMERYQSTHEHRVEINLSESGVHPLTVREFLDIAGVGNVEKDTDLFATGPTGWGVRLLVDMVEGLAS